MKRVATHESLAYLGHLKNVLEQSGIRCLLRNEQLSGALGEIPFLDCLPELWVLRDDQQRAAESVLRELREVPSAAPAWQCSSCGESNEGQFAACWQCGHPDDRGT